MPKATITLGGSPLGGQRYIESNYWSYYTSRTLPPTQNSHRTQVFHPPTPDTDARKKPPRGALVKMA